LALIPGTGYKHSLNSQSLGYAYIQRAIVYQYISFAPPTEKSLFGLIVDRYLFSLPQGRNEVKGSNPTTEMV
jgi:hypothetical protein